MYVDGALICECVYMLGHKAFMLMPEEDIGSLEGELEGFRDI